MADLGLSSFIAGLAGNTRVPQVSNDAFYNQIIQNNINEKRLKEARAYQEQQTEKAMKYQRQLLQEKMGLELEEERRRALASWVAENSRLVDETDKKSVDAYNKAYETQRRLLWGGKAIPATVTPKEEKPKKKGEGIIPATWKILFGSEADTAPVERVASEIGRGLLHTGSMVKKSVEKGGIVGAPAEYMTQAFDPFVQAYQQNIAMPTQQGMDYLAQLLGKEAK